MVLGMTKKAVSKVVAAHPGECVREEILARGWSEVEFARMIGRSTQALSRIISGDQEITREIAIMLSAAFGTSSVLWTGLQENYVASRRRGGARV